MKMSTLIFGGEQMPDMKEFNNIGEFNNHIK